MNHEPKAGLSSELSPPHRESPGAPHGNTTLRASYDRVAGEYAARVAGELVGKPLDRALLAAFAEQVGALGPAGGAGHALVCDAGCGPGHVATHLARLLAGTGSRAGTLVEGVDLSPGMVAEAGAAPGRVVGARGRR